MTKEESLRHSRFMIKAFDRGKAQGEEEVLDAFLEYIDGLYAGRGPQTAYNIRRDIEAFRAYRTHSPAPRRPRFDKYEIDACEDDDWGDR